MKTDSKLYRLIFVSPWTLLVFLIIPLGVILSVSLHIRLPLATSKYPLLYNNACFTLLIALRFLYCLLGTKKALRYGAAYRVPRKTEEIPQSADTVRSSLTGAGYIFDDAGSYAEKRDGGYLGITILYGGLFIALFTGTLDNMRQFSGILLDSIGKATDLSQRESYGFLTTGPLAAKPTTLPKIKILRQFIPDATYPLGGAEVLLQFADGKEQTTVLKAPDPYRVGPYDIRMSRMVYEPWITVTLDGTKPVFNGRIKLNPLATKVDGYGFYAPFSGSNFLDGEVYYQPEKSRLRVKLNQTGIPMMDTEMIFQVDLRKTAGNLAVACDRMGVWSEIHVVHRRHLPIIFFGIMVAVIGLLMRVMIRPKRVWLEDAADGCRVKAVHEETFKLLKGK